MFIHYGGCRVFRHDHINCLCWSSSSVVFICGYDVKRSEQKNSWFTGKETKHIHSGLIVGNLVLLELLVVVGGWQYKDDLMSSSTLILSNTSNTHQLGLVMYTDFVLYFQLAGIILLLSMIGAILLTFRERVGVKRQSYIKQISRNPSSAVELKDVESNKGVRIDD